jgi:hypothetical protein
LASRSEILDGLKLAVSLGYEADIIHPAVADHSLPADFDKICVVIRQRIGEIGDPWGIPVGVGTRYLSAKSKSPNYF